MRTATLLRTLPGWETHTGLYRLAPPLLVDGDLCAHVVVTTVPRRDGDHGSVVLPASADGHVTSWHWLHRTDSDDHADALADLGYQVVTP